MNATNETMNDPARMNPGAGGAGGGEMGRFFSDVEDLLRRVTNMDDADITRLRQRVEGSLSSAKDSVTRGASRVRESASEMADTTDDYVRRRPWTVAGIAMVAGAMLGAALLSRTRR